MVRTLDVCMRVILEHLSIKRRNQFSELYAINIMEMR